MAKKTYLEVIAQIDELQQEAERLRAEEVSAVLEDVRQKVAQYGLTEQDVFGRKRAKANGAHPAAKAPGAPKYQDPKSGAMWSGKGRAPAWIAKARNRDRFLIAE